MHSNVWLTDVDDITEGEWRHFLFEIAGAILVTSEATPLASSCQFKAHSAVIYNVLVVAISFSILNSLRFVSFFFPFEEIWHSD